MENKQDYIIPDLETFELNGGEVLCASNGIDPSVNGMDFTWGNGSGTDPNGNGYFFNCGL